jgi:hypothetical protein
MLFGLIPDDLATKPVDQANKAVQSALDRISPLLQDVENRAGGILHGLLDRLNGTTIEVKINIPPIPKAVPVNPPPE